MPTRIQIAKPDVVKLFDEREQHVYMRKEIATILASERQRWRLSQATGVEGFIDFLVKKSHLRRIVLKATEYDKEEVRYAWRSGTPYEVALALRTGAYLTHGTAVFLHALTDQIPNMVFVNVEQSPKPEPTGNLSDESLKRAFSSPQRFTRLIYQYEGYQIAVLSGKNTQRLEVGPILGPNGETLETTKLERTLIDITVRPAYSGGVHKVLEAYRAAKDRVSVNTLVATLKKLNYVYPYHQAIGFYMEKADYDPARLTLIEKLPRDYDFFLANGLEDPKFDAKWRLFYPNSGF